MDCFVTSPTINLGNQYNSSHIVTCPSGKINKLIVLAEQRERFPNTFAFSSTGLNRESLERMSCALILIA